MNTLRNIALFAIMALALVVSISAANEPAAPMTLTPGASSTMDADNWGTQQTDALAGNITWLTISGLTQTRAWQGYWGNITGYITLDDANNQTFYNWSAAEPRGQIYATLVDAGSVSWDDVVCFDHDNNASLFQTYYGIAQDDYDNVTITYNETNHPMFQIVQRDITTCPTTYIWRDDGYQADDFVNVLMYDGAEATGNQSWVFVTIIENKDLSNKTDITCYNGQNCDFQLLVAEDEHLVTGVTPYYFWVDITG